MNDCKHENTYKTTTMSFIFTKCSMCNKIIKTETNRDPSKYEEVMGRGINYNKSFYSPF